MPYVPGKGWVEDDQPRIAPGRSPVRRPASPPPARTPEQQYERTTGQRPSGMYLSGAEEARLRSMRAGAGDPHRPDVGSPYGGLWAEILSRGSQILELPNAWLGERIDYLRSGDPIEPVAGKVFKSEGAEPPTLGSRQVGEMVRGGARDVGLVDAILSPMHYSRMILGGGVDVGREIFSGDLLGAGREVLETGAEMYDFARGHAAFTAELATDLALDPVMWTVPLTRIARTGTRAVRGLLPRISRQPGALVEELGGVEARGVFERELQSRLGAALGEVGGEEVVFRASPEAAARVRSAIHESARRALPNLGDEAATIIEAETYQAVNYFAGPQWRYGPKTLGRYRGVAAQVGDDAVLRGQARALGGDVAGTRYTPRVEQMRRAVGNSGATPTEQEIAEYVHKFGADAGMPDDALEALTALEFKFWRPGTGGQIVGGSVMPGVGGSPVTAGLYQDLGYLDDAALAARQIIGEDIALSPAAQWLQEAQATLSRSSRRAGQRIGDELLTAATPLEQTIPHVSAPIRGIQLERERVAEDVLRAQESLKRAYASLRTLKQEELAEQAPITGPTVDVNDPQAMAESARARGDEAGASYWQQQATGEVEQAAEGTIITAGDIHNWIREKGGAASLDQILEAADVADSDLVVDALQQAKQQGLVTETASDVMGWTEFVYTVGEPVAPAEQPLAPAEAPVAADAPLAEAETPLVPRAPTPPTYEPSGREALETEDQYQLRRAQERGDRPAIVHYTRRIQEARAAQQAARRAPATPEEAPTPTPAPEEAPRAPQVAETTPEQAPVRSEPVQTIEEALADAYPEPLYLDQIVAATGRPIHEVSPQITIGTLQGSYVADEAGTRYTLADPSPELLEAVEERRRAAQAVTAEEMQAGREVAAQSSADPQQAVLGALSEVPTLMDDLAAQAGLSVAQAATALMLLELQGKVKRFPGNKFTVAGAPTPEAQEPGVGLAAPGPVAPEAPETAPAAPQAAPEVAGQVEAPAPAPEAPAGAEAQVLEAIRGGRETWEQLLHGTRLRPTELDLALMGLEDANAIYQDADEHYRVADPRDLRAPQVKEFAPFPAEAEVASPTPAVSEPEPAVAPQAPVAAEAPLEPGTTPMEAAGPKLPKPAVDEDALRAQQKRVADQIDELVERAEREADALKPVSRTTSPTKAARWRNSGYLVHELPGGATFRFAKARAPKPAQVASWEAAREEFARLREEERVLEAEAGAAIDAAYERRQTEVQQRIEANRTRVLDRLQELYAGGSCSYAGTDSGHAPQAIAQAVTSAEGIARGFRAASRDETSFAITDVLVPSDLLTQEAARMRWPSLRDAATQVDELKWIADSNAGNVKDAAQVLGMSEDYTYQLLTGPVATDLGFRVRERDDRNGSWAERTSFTHPESPNWPTAEQATWQTGMSFDEEMQEGPGADVLDEESQFRSIIATQMAYIAENEERALALAAAEAAMQEQAPRLAALMQKGVDTSQTQQRAEGATQYLDRGAQRLRALTTYWPNWRARDAHRMKTAVDSALSYKQRVKSWGNQLFGRLPRYKGVIVTQLMAMRDYELREDLKITDDLTLPAGLEVVYTDADRLAAIYEGLDLPYDEALLAQGYDALPKEGKQLWDVAQAGLDLLRMLYYGETRDGTELFAIRGVRALWDDMNEWADGAYLGESRGFVQDYFPQPRVVTDIPEWLVGTRGLLKMQGVDPQMIDEMLEHIAQFKRRESIEYRRTFTKLGARLIAQAARMQEAGGEIDAEAALLLTQMDPVDAMNWYADQVARVSLRHDIIKFVRETFPTVEEIEAELGPGAVETMRAAGFRELTIMADPSKPEGVTLPGTEGRLMPEDYARVLEARLLGQSGTAELLSSALMSLAQSARSVWSSAQVAVLATHSFIVANLFEYVFRPVFQGINPVSREWAKNTAIVTRLFNRAVLNTMQIVPDRPLQPKRTAVMAAAIGGSTYALASQFGDPMVAGMVGAAAAMAPVAGALTWRVRQILATAGERTAQFWRKEAGISEAQLEQYVRELIDGVVVTSGFGAQSMEQLTHLLPRVPGRAEDVALLTHQAAEVIFRRDFSEESRKRAAEIGHAFDLTREDLRDLTEAMSLLFFGWDNLHRATAYITHRERGESPERARAIVREHTAEYTPGASTPALNAAQAVLWYSTFMLQTGEQLARKASQYPGVALAAAEMWRKRNRYAGLDREAELWFGGRKWYKQRGPEWVALPWNTLLLPETARPGPTITAEKGPGLLSVRLRVVPAEEAGVWGELALDPAAWLEEKLVPGARMLAEGSGRSSYNVGKQLPVVGRYASLREEIPGSPGEWGSPAAKLGRGEDVTNEELAAYIMPQATLAAVERIQSMPGDQRTRAWAQYAKTRACPLECQARRVMWREDPQKAAQYELEMMRLMYDLRLAGRRTGLSFDVEFGKDLLGNMNLGQLTEAQAEALWKQSQGIKPLASPKLYQEQIDDRTSYNPETGQYVGKGPRTHFEQLDSIWEAVGRGTARPTGTAQPQAEGAAR